MDYQSYNRMPEENKRRSKRMENTAFVFGIIAIATSCLVYTSLICGSLAIVLALLSRGGESTLTPRAKAGLIMGGIGLGIVILMLAYTLFVANVYYDGLEDMMRQMYSGMGIDFDALMQSYYK